jgi:DNA-binding transcriptional MocR family regulator
VTQVAHSIAWEPRNAPAGLLQRALAEANVAFEGGAFFHDCRGRNTVRLSCLLPGEAEIDRGIAALAQLI